MRPDTGGQALGDDGVILVEMVATIGLDDVVALIRVIDIYFLCGGSFFTSGAVSISVSLSMPR